MIRLTLWLRKRLYQIFNNVTIWAVSTGSVGGDWLASKLDFDLETIFVNLYGARRLLKGLLQMSQSTSSRGFPGRAGMVQRDISPSVVVNVAVTGSILLRLSPNLSDSQ